MAKNRDVADLDWKNLPFSYIKTDYNIRYYYKDGQWSGGELVDDDMMSVHMAAPGLHYGQQAFEGLKAFETVDGRIVTFRAIENAKRLQQSCSRIFMPEVPEEIFLEAVEKVIAANVKYVPPYGNGASLYIRPLVIGTGAKVGLGPAPEFTFLVFVTPVGPYYKGGFKPVKALVLDRFDRAAPLGVGDCKVGGNYAAGLGGQQYGQERGYPIVLYLDSKEKKYIDEFGTSNFIGIIDGSYVTPQSNSILASITNKSLAQIAESQGMKVERRPIKIDELCCFDEVGAVGTAAVVTPVNRIDYKDTSFTFGNDEKAGKIITNLYEKYVKIQLGESEDLYSWLNEVNY